MVQQIVHHTPPHSLLRAVDLASLATSAFSPVCDAPVPERPPLHMANPRSDEGDLCAQGQCRDQHPSDEAQATLRHVSVFRRLPTGMTLSK